MNWIDLEKKVKHELLGIYDDRETNNMFNFMVVECCGKPMVLAKFGDLTAEVSDQILLWVNRLKRGDSMQVAMGYTYFGDLKLTITKDVLAPRPETEELVHWMKENIQPTHSILDIGTGSACIPLWLKNEFPEAEVHAMDVSDKALEVAKRNANDLQLPITFHLTDILSTTELPQQYHHIVSNPPYIPNKERLKMSNTVLNNDPDLALFVPDNDPLLFYKAIAKLAHKSLFQGGFLWFELHEDFAQQTADMVENLGYKNVTIKEDMQQKMRMLRAQKLD
jgi:release factor glutamine methyltransferase